MAVVVPLGVNGICFTRALAAARIPAVAVTDDLQQPTSRTRLSAVVGHPEIHTPALVDVLAQLGATAKARPVLFVLADVQALLVSEHREYLRTWYDFALPSHEVMQLLLDKLLFSQWAVERNLPVAATWCVREAQQIEDIAAAISYPCILKPRYRDHRWASERLPKGIKISDASGLRSCYRFVSRWQRQVVISEWVEGPDSNLYIGHIYVGRGGSESVVFLTRKLRQYPPSIGTTTLAVAWRDDRLTALTANVYSNLDDYHGFGAVEIKIDARSGEPRILEPMAGRCSMIWYPALLQGLNLAYLAYCDVLGQPAPPWRLSDNPAKWLDERPDLASAWHYIRRGELTVADYLRSIGGRKVCVHVNWRDPMPGVGLMLETLALSAQKALSRRSARESRRTRTTWEEPPPAH
ncbi:MAG: hypothetical protein JSV65_14280 [Armatimonadota bacterium]|nr:MAG: hypothetical protein JSV65_14280 [Armatimonadota bacterium]